jgi:predicted Zn-dependent protease
MAGNDWFRTSDWDKQARADFESRLARARSHNRPQYLRIKAVALREAGENDGAGELLARVLREYPDSFDTPFCAELLADHAVRAADFREAEALYRESMRLRPDMNATSGEVHIGLAEALIAQGRHQESVDALQYVPVARLGLNQSICRWNVALADAAHGLGEEQVAADAAARALALLDTPDQFTRHPGVGRAVLTEQQVAWLRSLTSGEAS